MRRHHQYTLPDAYLTCSANPQVRTIKVEEPTESFFNFFEPPDMPDDEEEIDEEEAENLHDQLEQVSLKHI